MSDKETKETNRRDFIFLATGAVAAVGVASAAWPLIHQMNPDSTALALSTIEVDVSGMNLTPITVLWRGKPVFIRRRTRDEIDLARSVSLDDLPDGLARNNNATNTATATDENRSIEGKEEWLVMLGVCTHLGCVPKGQSIGMIRVSIMVGSVLVMVHIMIPQEGSEKDQPQLLLHRTVIKQ